MSPRELRDIRKKMQLTQIEMAIKLELSLRGYRQYECDERPIPGPVKLLARILARSVT